MKIKTHIERIVLPVQAYIKELEMSGILLLLMTILALILANSHYSHEYLNLWHAKIGLYFGDYKVESDGHFFINDVLMTLFFIVVGGEIKREFIEGALSSREKAALPIIAAIGGMLFPAIIYVAFNWNLPTSSGWGIPTATDIAFSLTIISLLGKRVPFSIKIFLAALAIADDLGAIIVIALFYSTSLDWSYLLLASGVIAILFAINRLGVKNLFIYSFVGIILWYFFLKSGIHPTMAGVVLVLLVPFTSDKWEKSLNVGISKIKNSLSSLTHSSLKERLVREEIIENIQSTAAKMNTPLQNLMEALHPVSNYFIMPLFAFANAGVVIDLNALENIFSPLSLGIIFGLMIGKSTGIWATSRLAVKLKIGALMEDVTWKQIYGMGWVAGIGFTMSMFVSDLAFKSKEYIDTAKIAILLASLLSGIIGYIILSAVSDINKQKQRQLLK